MKGSTIKQDDVELKGSPESFEEEEKHIIDNEIKDQSTNEEIVKQNKPKRQRRSRTKKGKEETVKLGVSLPKSLVKQLKLQVVRDDDNISSWIEKVLRRSISKRTSKKEET